MLCMERDGWPTTITPRNGAPCPAMCGVSDPNDDCPIWNAVFGADEACNPMSPDEIEELAGNWGCSCNWPSGKNLKILLDICCELHTMGAYDR